MGHHGLLHTWAFALFVALIPFFSVISIFGIKRAAKSRLTALLGAFPGLGQTISHQIFLNTYNRQTWYRYILPITFLIILNTFMSVILLDGFGLTDDISAGTYYLLCGAYCLDETNRNAYQIETLVTVSYAFLGWTVWTFTTIFDRASSLQLFPSTFDRLIIRLVVAVLVSTVVRHLIANDAEWLKVSRPALAFVVGVFPEQGLAFILDKFQSITRQAMHSADFPLDMIEGISPAFVFRLNELGIDNACDLAHANAFGLYNSSALPMSEVVDWMAQAQMLQWVKADAFRVAQKAGYRTIFDLARLLKQPQGPAAFATLCGATGATGFNFASISSSGEYVRLLQIFVIIGGTEP
jgi:hypothetical protein